MIIVTGALGFIGSCMVSKLNDEGYEDIIIVDDFPREEKESNLKDIIYEKKIHRDYFESCIYYKDKIDFIFHIGARTDTTESNTEIFDNLNLDYSKYIWNFCVKHDIPLIYASSAASYGDGKFGYDDVDLSLINKLKPLNPYGDSKNEFDKWVLKQEKTPPNWYGLKFFNVFGPNEYHKGRMASVVYHSYEQIVKNNKVLLFKSHNDNYKDGGQLRDFIYVKDVVDVMFFLMKNKPKSDIYNLGTGKARSFLDLATSVFNSLNKEVNIEYIDTPLDIRDKYQYFTEAKMEKLISIGYDKPFYSLEDAIDDYVKKHLTNKLNF